MSVFAAILLSASLGADPGLTEARAVELALAQSPSLKALSARIDEFRAEVDMASRWENPQLRVQSLRSDLLVAPALSGASYADHPFQRTKIGLRWSPPELGAEKQGRTEAEFDVSEAKAERAQAERDLAARVRSLHATAVSLAKQLQLAQGAVDRRDKLRQLLKRRVDQGAATSLDWSISEIDFLDAVSAREEVEIRRRQALDSLRGQLGLSPEAGLELSAEGPTCEEPPASAALLERAVQNSPTVSTLKPHLDAVEAERRLAWLELVPYPDFIQLSYVLASDNAPSYFTLQFGLTLPLLDLKSADRRMLSAKRERVQQEQRAAIVELEREIHRALADQGAQAAQARRFRQSSLLLDERLEGARKALEAGQTSNLVLVEQLETRALVTRRAMLRAELECRLYQIELERLVGFAVQGPR